MCIEVHRSAFDKLTLRYLNLAKIRKGYDMDVGVNKKSDLNFCAKFKSAFDKLRYLNLPCQNYRVPEILHV